MILKVYSFFFLILMLSAFDSFAGQGCSTGKKNESPNPTRYDKIICQKCHKRHETTGCPEIRRQQEIEMQKKFRDEMREMLELDRKSEKQERDRERRSMDKMQEQIKELRRRLDNQ